jgi:integration host factor subunit beta
MSLDLAGFKERQSGTNTLGRADLADEIQREFPKVPKVVMREIVDVFFGVISQALLAKKRVEIRGFGTLHAHRRNSRKSYIPSKGKISKVDANWTIKFVTGKVFRGKLMAHCEE